jgi:Carboxypeptidase regulatory-like domain
LYRVLLFLSFSAGAQLFCQAFSGSIKGTITDVSGALIPGAKVTVETPNGQEESATTGADGEYTLASLPAGSYSVEATVPGFQQTKPLLVTVGSRPVILNIALAVAANKQELTVAESVGPAISTDPAQNASAIVMRGDDLSALSDDPDDLQADLQALAGPAAGPNGGQIYIDGFTGGDAPLPNKDAIREVRVNQNPFSPEYDSIGFGRIEILTKPGADKFRGGAYYNYGDSAMNSRNPYAPQKAPFDLNEYGGNLGGPLGNHASFFTDVDNRDIENGGIINAIVLNSALSQAIPFTQTYSDPLRHLRTSSRLDYQLGKSNTLIFRYTFAHDGTDNAGVGNFNLATQGYRTAENEHDLEITETAVLSPKMINETHYQFRHQNYTQSSPDTDPAVIVSNSFNGGGSSSGLHDYIHHHYEVQNYTSVTSPKQTWKFGIRLRAVDIQDTAQQNFNGTYTFGGAYAPMLGSNNMPLVPGIVCQADAPQPGCETIASIEQYRRTLVFQQMGLPAAQIRLLGGGATQFSINAGNPYVHAGGWDAGLFVGDDWKLSPNLTVSLGLRYETQANISDHSDFAPRLGFAWSPGKATASGGHNYVIRGGFGIFYDRFSEQNVLQAQRFNGLSQQQFVVENPDTFPNIPSASALTGFAQTETVHTIASSLQAPYVLQSALGVERQLPGHTTVSVNMINTHGLHELLSRDINAPLPGTYTGVPGSGIYPYGNRGPILEMESAGLYNQNQLTVNVNSRMNARVSFWGYYSLNFAKSNTDGVGTSPANQYDLHDEYGPAATDVRNRVGFGGSFIYKWGLRLSPFVSLQSGAPFNIVTSQDVYCDTLLTARPGIATDPNRQGVLLTPYGALDPNPLPGDAILPRNYGRGPGQFNVNSRLSKTFGFGPERESSTPPAAGTPAYQLRRYQLTFSLSARNILNHVNKGPVVGNINSPFFGESTQIAGGSGAFGGSANNRRLELQARFNF